MRLLAVVLPAAFACTLTCAGPSTACGICRERTLCWPHPDQKAPTNTHVFLQIRDDWETAPIACESGKYCTPRSFEFTLRRVDKVEPEREVSVRQTADPDWRRVELIPKSDLAPSAEYEVRLVERRRLVFPITVATIHTASGPDRDAPKWSGIASTGYHDGDLGMERYVSVSFEAPEDTSPVRYAVWLTDPKSHVDTTATPALVAGAIKTGTQREVRIGGALAGCRPTMKLPTGTVDLTLAPIDAAGNLGTASTKRISIPAPK
jgi:hypothetical protein